MIKRVRYFAGQLLGAEDFEAEQRYVIDRFRRLNRWLHGWGVVGGLGVSIDGGEIVVTPGLALDCMGHEIEVERPTCVALPAGGQARYLILSFVERPADPQPALFEPPGADEVAVEYRRIEEGAALALAPADPARVHGKSARRSDACGRAHPLAIARIVRVRSRWRVDSRFRPGRARG
ncbi:MAG TPA: hypothetical protein VIA61_15555 [Methylomirabilota bacterium]|jgi:hypothetical protein